MRVLATLQLALSLNPRRVLEIGAGDASLTSCLVARGVSASANDIRQEALTDAVEMYKNHDKINLLPGNVFDLDPSQTGRFDLITACEVIEHAAFPLDFLRHLKKFLEPKGKILLTTPNGSYFRNRLPTYTQIKDPHALVLRQFKPDADGHLFLLTPTELSDLVAQAGLYIQDITLCGTPPITGHGGLALFRSLPVSRLCYSFERACQTLPRTLKEKLCFSMSVVTRTTQFP
jgi:2-polyprenyl-3-methyl-5-hydroxy-6-metoxy-1,4-benzoquinol methylase